MALLKTRTRYTVDEYLRMERAAEERHVFLDGEIFAMAGESDAHGDLGVNLTGLFYNQLKGTDCRARIMNCKVRSGPMLMGGQSTKGMFSYPDLVVICGEVEHHD